MNKEKLIYIDWNLYSILKDPKLDPHIILKEFINKNVGSINLVYSDAHLGDLAKTSGNLSELRIKDLKYLSKLTNDLSIVKYFGRSDVEVGDRNALEFYNTNRMDNETAPLNVIQDAVKTMTDLYGDNRDNIIRNHFKTDPKNICNFSVSQIDELIKMMGISDSLKGFIEFGIQLRGNTTRNPITYIDNYITAYTSLDLIGFFPDSMKKKGDFDNLLNDSKHSAYGSLCKAFITNDNKFYHKSKFLFEYFKSKSKLIRTCKINNNLIEFEEQLNELLN